MTAKMIALAKKCTVKMRYSWPRVVMVIPKSKAVVGLSCRPGNGRDCVRPIIPSISRSIYWFNASDPPAVSAVPSNKWIKDDQLMAFPSDAR